MYNPKSKQSQEKMRIENTMLKVRKLAFENGVMILIQPKSESWFIYVMTEHGNWADTAVLPPPLKAPIEYSEEEIMEFIKKEKPEVFL
jgi:hypothetical protein